MIVSSRQLRPIKRLRRTASMPVCGVDAAGRGFALLVGVLGFACFMPYPAIRVGNSTAIQTGNVLTVVLLLPLLWTQFPRRVLCIYPLLLAPLCLSTLHVAVNDGANLSLCLKSVLVWAISCLTLVAVQVHAPRHAVALLTGAAVAALLHAAVGVLQFFSFQDGEFPLAWLYVNPSFLSVQENAATIARWTQRPFGLFPEPSAMSSSLAPWVLFWFAQLCGVVRLRHPPARWQRALFAAAAGGSLGLIILSQSGHAAVTLLALMGVAGIWIVRSRATSGTFLWLATMLLVVLPASLWFGASAVGDRLGGSAPMGNSSWQDRSESLLQGLWYVADGGAMSILFGVGPGLVAVAMQKTAGFEAVWSVLLSYIYDTGIPGLAAVGWIGWQLCRSWRAAKFDPVFAAIGGTWLVGATVTTSYEQLLPIWLTVGWLAAWPVFCESGARHAAVYTRQPRNRNDSKRRNTRWTELPVATPAPAGPELV